MNKALLFNIPFALSCGPKAIPHSNKQYDETAPIRVAQYLKEKATPFPAFHRGVYEPVRGYMKTFERGQETVVVFYVEDTEKRCGEDLIVSYVPSKSGRFPKEKDYENHMLYVDIALDGTIDILEDRTKEQTIITLDFATDLDPVKQMQHTERYHQTLVDILAAIDDSS